MMSCTVIEDDDHNNYSIESSSPPTNQRMKDLDNFLKSPTAVLDFVGSARSDEDTNSNSYDGNDISENTNWEDDSDSQQFVSNHHQNNAEHEEKQISNELEETRKSAEEMKNRIGLLRGQSARRRALRNRIVKVRSSRVLEEEHHNDVNDSLPECLQDKPILREAQEGLKENMNSPIPKPEGRPWLSPRGQKKQPAPVLSPLQAAVERSTAFRDADELLLSLQSTSTLVEEDDDDERSLSSSCKEQQKQVEAGRRKRFEKRDSWGSFIPKSRG